MDGTKLVDKKIASLTDWRGPVMRQLREAIRSVNDGIVEEIKWMGTPVWNHGGILCLANAHKAHVKLTFPKGAKLPDPKRVFNAELEGNAWRALDVHEGDAIDIEGLKGIVRAAIALNGTKPAKRKAGEKSPRKKRVEAKAKPKKVAARKPAAKKK